MAAQQSEDAALAQRASEGDERAFTALVERYQQPAFNFALRLLGSYDDAADAAQQGFVQLYLNLPELDTSRPIRPWLFRAIRNRCIDLIRQRRTVSLSAAVPGEEGEWPAIEDQLADPDPLPEDLVERADLQELLTAAIDRLPTRYREVVSMRYTTDMTFAEMGEVLGLPENTAKIHFHRAKALLRQALKDVM